MGVTNRNRMYMGKISSNGGQYKRSIELTDRQKAMGKIEIQKSQECRLVGVHRYGRDQRKCDRQQPKMISVNFYPAHPHPLENHFQ